MISYKARAETLGKPVTWEAIGISLISKSDTEDGGEFPPLKNRKDKT